MASEKSASVDLSGLEDAFDWVKARKNALVGSFLVLLLVFAGVTFFRRLTSNKMLQPWREVFAPQVAPWDATPTDLGKLLDDQVIKGTPAEPFLLYWRALRTFDDGDRASALEQLTTLQSRFASHQLCTTKLLDHAPDTRSTIERVSGEMQRLAKWGQQFPVPTANTAPSSKSAVTLLTTRGKISFALFRDSAAKSCESFLRTAPLLKGLFIAKSLAGQWIEIGQDAAGVAPETKDLASGFPPFEENHLWHFAGTVAFRQPPFSKGPFYADLRVFLSTDFNEDGKSTVFAQVIDGLDTLTTLSKEPRKPDAPQTLAAPVQITDVVVEVDGAPPVQPPPGN